MSVRLVFLGMEGAFAQTVQTGEVTDGPWQPGNTFNVVPDLDESDLVVFDAQEYGENFVRQQAEHPQLVTISPKSGAVIWSTPESRRGPQVTGGARSDTDLGAGATIEEWPGCVVQGAEAFLEGDIDLALSASLSCLSSGRQEPICAYTAACCYTKKGAVDSALDWLERSVEWESAGASLMGADPCLDSLRGNSRFAKLLTSSAARGDEEAGKGRSLTPESTGFFYSRISPLSIAGHPLQPVMAVGWEDGSLDIVDLEKGRRVKSLSQEWVPRSPVQFLDGGTLVASIVEGPRVVIWDVKSGAVKAVADIASGDSRPKAVHFPTMRVAKGGEALAILTLAGDALIARRADSWKITACAYDGELLRDLAWGPNGRLYGIVKEGKLLTLGGVSGSEWSVVTNAVTFTACRGLAVSPSGLEIAVWGDTVGLGIVNVASGRVRVTEKTDMFGDAGPFYAAFSPTGSRVLLTGGAGGHVWMLSVSDLSDVWSVPGGGGSPFPIRCGFVETKGLVYIAQNAGGGQVLGIDDGELRGVFPCRSGQRVAQVHGGILSMVKSGVAYSPLDGDGWKVLYFRSHDGHEVVVTDDGRFAMSSWATAARFSISLGGARAKSSLASLAGELHAPHGIRVILSGLFSAR